jgi:Fe-S-cluster containining protein
VDAIAAFLDMDVLAFTEKYTRLRPGRDGLSLTEQADGACIFLDGMDCAIQSVKPAQCREFPNKWNFPGWREICKAIPVGSDVPAIPQTESARE